MRHCKVRRCNIINSSFHFSFTDLKDTVEELDSDAQSRQQAVTQLKNENAKLQKLLHEKEDQLKRR